MNQLQIANSIALQFPIGSIEVCNKHEMPHLHLLCEHGKMVADLSVAFDCITNEQTLEFCFWDTDKDIPPFVFEWVRNQGTFHWHRSWYNVISTSLKSKS